MAYTQIPPRTQYWACLRSGWGHGSSRPETVSAASEIAREFAPSSFVPGTRRLLHAGYLSGGVEHRAGLFEIDLDGGEPRRILDADADHDLSTPTVSPDGSWLAYRSNESGRSEIYLRSFPDLSRKIPVGEGRNPQWGPKGKKLYFTRCVESAPWRPRARPRLPGVAARRVHVPTSLSAKESSRDRGSIWVRDVSFGGSKEDPVFSDACLVSDAPGLGFWRVDPLGRGLPVLKTVEDMDVVDHFEFVQGWGRGAA